MKPAARTRHLRQRGEGVHCRDVAAMTGPAPASGAEGGESAAPASAQPVHSGTVRVTCDGRLNPAQPRAWRTHTGSSALHMGTMKPPLHRASRRVQEQGQSRERKFSVQPDNTLRPTRPPDALSSSPFSSLKDAQAPRAGRQSLTLSFLCLQTTHQHLGKNLPGTLSNGSTAS